VTNYNDAAITDIFVGETASWQIENDAPNSPTASGEFNVTVEMVAGFGLDSGGYTLTVSCADVTSTASVPSLAPGAPLNGADTFGSASWTKVGNYLTFEQTQTVNNGAGAVGGNHVYQYTATLVSGNGNVVSSLQSALFTLV
jgi:hypothetical protein